MKTFQSSILRGLLFAVALLPFILASQSAAGQYIPRAYWRFESPADTLDASGNGHNININPTWITTDNLNPIAGNYLTIDLNDPLPGVGGINEVDSIGEMRQEFTVEFWFRAAKDFYTGRFQWFNKMEAHFEESRILFLVRLNANMTDTLLLNLNGVGTSGANTVYDGDWHHYVFQYSAKSGEQRLYIDGNSPQDLGYSIVHGASSGVRDGGVLWFSQPGGGYRLSGHLDEFAIFDTLIPPTLVWQHYLQGLSGSAYTFVDTVTVRPEFPQAIAQQEVNELEFGPGYPNVSDSVISLLRAYPLPRYLPNQDFRRLVPWLSDPDSLVDGTSIASRGPEMVKLIEELEENWNYYLYSGVLKSNFGYRRYLDSNNIAFNVNIKEYYLVQMLNDSSNFGKPRFMISNWPQLEPRHLLPEKIPFAYINYDTINTSWAPSLPDDFFIRDGQGNPKPLAFGKQRKNFAMANPLYLNDYRLHDSIRFDGLVNRWYVERFFSLIDSTQHYIDLIGENDETQAIYSWSAIREDAEIRLDMDTNGYDTLTQERIYQAERLNTMREVFRDPFRNFIDSLNAAAGREDLEFWWYELRGGGDGNDTLFPVQKPIVAYRDGFQRSGPYLYPNLPLRWRSGGGEFKGLRELVESRYWELMDEENLFLPALSPGFCHFSYQVADRDMMRPAQFLAYLKGIAMLGADSYALFTYHDSPIHPTRARWRTWKMPMLAYAQAISSRISDYLYSGQVLLGDVFSSAVGVGPSRYTFNTGNLNDFVSGRQLTGQNRFVVSGSIQRRSNAIAAAPRAKDVCIQLSDTASTVVIPELQFEIRTQGSTYLLDLSGPAPVFYQLDKWHEAKDPWHWCRDFAFEAEVFDSATGVSNFTERPGTPAAGDYREFTSYVEVPPTSGLLRYHFTPRHSEQDSLYLWVRARGSADSLTAIIGGTTVTLANFPTNNFDWVGSVTPIPTPVHTEQIAELRVYGDTLDLDQVVFKRSGDDFTAQSFSVSISADTLVCFGDTTNFYNASGAPSGCVDYFWDFGDGTFAYAAQPGHVYNYPGAYWVHFALYHQCLDSTVTDSILVRVDAPLVDAGEDGLQCSGDSVQLQGSTSAHLWHWRADSTIADTSNLTSMAWPVSGVWYVLTGTDTLTGCSLSDSVRHSTVNFNITYTDSVYLSPGQTATLTVLGGYGYDWAGDPTLSDTTIFNPVATPCDTTVYRFSTWDACHCDTISGTIAVFMPELYQQFLSSDYDSLNCSGDSIFITAGGLTPGDSLSWTPGGTIFPQNDSVFAALPAGPTVYYATLIGSGGGCLSGDSIVLDVNNCCSTPNLLHLFSPRASTWTLPTANNAYHIIDTFLIDASITFMGCRLVMDSMAVIWVEPGETLTLDSCIVEAACGYAWDGIYIADSTARVNIQNNSLIMDGTNALRSLDGGDLRVEGSTFQNNWVGIWIDKYPGSHPAIIRGNRFTSADSMHPPFANSIPEAGIWVTDVGEVAIGQASGVNDRNDFDTLNIGIFGLRSNIRIQNNRFTGIVPRGGVKKQNLSYAGQGCGIYTEGMQSYAPAIFYTTEVGGSEAQRNYFAGCTKGVKVQHNVRLECRRNTFADISVLGVLVQECHGDSVFVNANKFSNPWIGVRGIYNYYTHVEVAQDTFIGDSSHSGVGIWMDDINFFGLSNAGDYSITDNLVDLYGFGIGSNGCNNLVIDQNEVHIRGIHSTYGTGAGIAANGSDSALVRENEVRGYAALAEEIDGILVSSSPEVQVKCNEIFNFRNDLRFRFPSLAANVRENVFHAGLRGWVYQDSANLSTQGGPGDPAGNTWNSGTPGQSWNCPGTGTFMSLVINTTLNNEFMYVRNTQFQNPEHSNNPQCFGGLQGVGYHLTTSGGGPATCGPVGNSGGDPGSNRVAVLNGIADENAAAKGDAAPLRYQKEQYALAVLDGDTGLCQSDPKLQDCHQRLNTGNRKDILTTQRKLAAGQATAALAHNGFAPKNQIESNHRFVTRAIAKWAIERLIEATDSTELREIAGQCPPVGGRAVYQARTLLGLLDPALILLNHGCSSAAGANKQADAGEEASSLPLVEFYPNPAGSVLRVKSGDAVKVGMYNLHGVALRNWELDPGTNRLDLPRVPAGVYLFRYQLESGQRGTVRIVLR